MLYDSYMALLINELHILYYQMPKVRSALLELSYFISPDHLTVKTWVWAMSLFPDLRALIGPFTYGYENIFQRVVGYGFDGFPCQCIVAVLILLDFPVVTTFSCSVIQ